MCTKEDEMDSAGDLPVRVPDCQSVTQIIGLTELLTVCSVLVEEGQSPSAALQAGTVAHSPFQAKT